MLINPLSSFHHRSLCKFLYNVYHPCDPVAYRVEPVFMKFYSKVEPVHLLGAAELGKVPYSELPLQPLQNARKDDDQVRHSNIAGAFRDQHKVVNMSTTDVFCPHSNMFYEMQKLRDQQNEPFALFGESRLFIVGRKSPKSPRNFAFSFFVAEEKRKALPCFRFSRVYEKKLLMRRPKVAQKFGRGSMFQKRSFS